MLERVITLTDGPHKVRTPSRYALDLMAVDGTNLIAPIALENPDKPTAEDQAKLTARDEKLASLGDNRVVAIIVAAMLTDAEEVDAAGRAAKVWAPEEVMRKLPLPAEDFDAVVAITAELREDAQRQMYPGAFALSEDAGDSRPPTKARNRTGTKR